MLRVCVAFWFLSISACISYPEVTTVDGTRDASVSPDGSARPIALVEELDRDASDAGNIPTDGGVLPHPERDSGAGEDREDIDEEDGGPAKGNGKGKPPKKKD